MTYGVSSTATIERRAGNRWEVVARHPRGELIGNTMVQGFWRGLWLSPDGRTLLAQWSSECEIPAAFFVSAEGGQPRVVTGEADWKKGAQSSAIGWQNDGRAIVRLGKDGCGNAAKEPGVYAIDPGTFAAEFLRQH